MSQARDNMNAHQALIDREAQHIASYAALKARYDKMQKALNVLRAHLDARWQVEKELLEIVDDALSTK
jgi:regulator of sigma D